MFFLNLNIFSLCLSLIIHVCRVIHGNVLLGIMIMMTCAVFTSFVFLIFIPLTYPCFLFFISKCQRNIQTCFNQERSFNQVQSNIYHLGFCIASFFFDLIIPSFNILSYSQAFVNKNHLLPPTAELLRVIHLQIERCTVFNFSQ